MNNNIKLIIRNYFEFLIYGSIRLLLPSSVKSPSSLIFINTGFLGDILVSSILLEDDSLFENYNQVAFLLREEYKTLFVEYSGKVNFIGINYSKYRKSIFYKYKILSMLKLNGYEVVINLNAARGILNEEIVHSIGGNYIICLNKFIRYLGKHLGSYYNSKYNAFIGIDKLNEYDKHVEIITYLNNQRNDLRLNNNNVFKFANENLSNKYDITKDSIIIAPFTSKMNREISLSLFKKILNDYHVSHKIFLIGTDLQKKFLYDNFSHFPNIEIITNLVLNELPYLFKDIKLFIGLDSGLTHLALKLNIPLIAFIGGGEFGRFFPYKQSDRTVYLFSKMDCFLCHWECYKKEMYCLTDVNFNQVKYYIDKLLTNEN